MSACFRVAGRSRMGDWEQKPLNAEQQRYAAMDAYACLLLRWELQQLPTKQTLNQRLIEAMKQRAVGEGD
jgi:ribonuclease D